MYRIYSILGSKKALRRRGNINWTLKDVENLKRGMIQNEQSDRKKKNPISKR